MRKMKSKKAYFDYLTRRLDSGESKNVVIATTVDIISRQLKKNNRVKVLDIGCFSGAMLNRIYQELPDGLRKKVDLVGVDSDREAMDYGNSKYRIIKYFGANLEKKIPLTELFNVIIICNVLHELFPESEIKTRVGEINRVFSDISKLLVDGGEIVLLDGIKPDDAKLDIEIEMISEKWGDKFERLLREYEAAELKGERLSDLKIKTNMFTLAVFLTKARYMDEEYWKSESRQLYQFYSVDNFRNMIEKAGLKVECLETQALSEDVLKAMIAPASFQGDLPVKNILIVAKKY